MKFVVFLLMIGFAVGCSGKKKNNDGGIITTGGGQGGGTTAGADGLEGAGTTGGTDGGTTGGTTGAEPPAPQPLQLESIFLDAPVTGLKYVSTSFSGHTDSFGKFYCNPGDVNFPIETISFYLSDQDESTTNDIYLGQIQCRAVVSPIELVSGGASNITADINSLNSNQQIRIKRILRIIQSLDSDNNPENGINFLPSEMALFADYLAATYSLTTAIGAIIHHVSVTDMEFNTSLTNIMTAISRPGQSRSEANALTHFNTWKGYCTTGGCTINYTCLQGKLYTDPVAPTFNIMDPVSGLNRGGYTESLTEALIVLHYNNLVALYRLETGTTYSDGDLWDQTFMRFMGTWTHSTNLGVGLQISNLEFESSLDPLSFSQATTLSGTVLVDENSFKALSLDSEREWVITPNCQVPTNLTLYPEP